MLKHQFSTHLTKENIDGLRKVCIFLIKHYVRAWFRSPFGTDSAYMDFSLIKAVLLDKSIDKDLVPLIMKKFSNHLFGRGDRSFGVFRFQYRTGDEGRNGQRLMLDSEIEDEDDLEHELRNGHRVMAKPALIASTYLTKKFSDFITPNTLNFFERFRIPTDFLREPVKIWEFSNSFKKGLDIARSLKGLSN